MRRSSGDRGRPLLDRASMVQDNRDTQCLRLLMDRRWTRRFELKYCVNSAIDISIFVDIFKKIMMATIISHGPKYIALFVLHNRSSSNTTQALVCSFFCITE